MLKEKSILEEGEFIVIKLQGGEEVIGKVAKSSSSAHITLDRPRVLVVQQLPDGQQSAGLAPLLQLADPDKTATFLERHIVSFAPMMAQVKDDYVNATSPLIQAPAAGKFQI